MGHESHDDTFLRRAVNPLVRTKLDMDRAGKPPSWATSDITVSILLFIMFGLPSLLLLYSSFGYAEEPKMHLPSIQHGIESRDFIFIPIYFIFGAIWGSFGLICFYLCVWRK